MGVDRRWRWKPDVNLSWKKPEQFNVASFLFINLRLKPPRSDVFAVPQIWFVRLLVWASKFSWYAMTKKNWKSQKHIFCQSRQRFAVTKSATHKKSQHQTKFIIFSQHVTKQQIKLPSASSRAHAEYLRNQQRGKFPDVIWDFIILMKHIRVAYRRPSTENFSFWECNDSLAAAEERIFANIRSPMRRRQQRNSMRWKKIEFPSTSVPSLFAVTHSGLTAVRNSLMNDMRWGREQHKAFCLIVKSFLDSTGNVRLNASSISSKAA